MIKAFNCSLTQNEVQITWTPMVGMDGEECEKARRGVGLVSTLGCSGKAICLITPTGEGCPFTHDDSDAIRDEWLNQG